MDFSNFLWMRDELSLLAVILVLFLYDTFSTEKGRRAFSWVACLLLAVQTAFLFSTLRQVRLSAVCIRPLRLLIL